MMDDPIVDEVHQTRERLLLEYGGMDGLLRHLREIEAEMPERVVSLEPRQPVEPAAR
jgi:hypothetical protein